MWRNDYDDYFGRNKPIVECEIDGIRRYYDACSSCKTKEEAIKYYYKNFMYIGSNNGVIYVNGRKNDFKSPYHFFIKLNEKELRRRKIKKLNNGYKKKNIN